MTDPTLKQAILQILSETDYLGNPYFRALSDGSLSKDDFVRTQIQFYSAVIHFHRPMSALASKIPDSDLRIPVLQNIWEEHGEGDLSQSHGVTFLEFLKRLAALTPQEVIDRTVGPEVRAFNAALSGACFLDDYRLGASMMGMIERMFCEISALIGQAVTARGWLDPQAMIHYNLHEKLDVRHAEDFFNVIEPSWRTEPASRETILQGLRLGMYLFNRLYADFDQARLNARPERR